MKYGTKPEVSVKVRSSCIRTADKYPPRKNPLRFQLPGIADGESLKTAAEQMSHAFLTSGKMITTTPHWSDHLLQDPDVVSPTLSMGAQLTSRQNALEALITFIGESGGLSKVRLPQYLIVTIRCSCLYTVSFRILRGSSCLLMLRSWRLLAGYGPIITSRHSESSVCYHYLNLGHEPRKSGKQPHGDCFLPQ
jgi:hypothetical protein